MNLKELTPAPWNAFGQHPSTRHEHVSGPAGDGTLPCVIECRQIGDSALANAEFVALARNAFEVMMRRGWYPVSDGGKWHVCSQGEAQKLPMELWQEWNGLVRSDPFTALVEADAWFKANVEAKP